MKAFYHCYGTGASVPSADPVQVASLRDAASLAFEVLLEQDDFFGLIDDEDKTIQFYVQEDGNVWVEFIAIEEQGSYGKQIWRARLLETINGMPEQFTKDALAGATFGAWQ